MLEAVDVDFGYDPGRPVLANWAARFAPGEVVAISGPSGRGKSTILYLLGLMLRPQSGHVLIDDRPVEALSDAERARFRAFEFGFVFQDAALDATRSVLDNVAESALYRGDERRLALGRARELLAQFGVQQRADARPGQLSGGQAQRIALCRALLGSPRFLLADEPTGNLDTATGTIVFEAFREHARGGATVIVVTHDPLIAARCDRTIGLA